MRGEAGARRVACDEAGADLAAPAGRQGDEVVVVRGQRGEPRQRRLATMLEVSGADDAAELRPARVVARQQHEMVAGAGELAAGRGGGEVGGRDVKDCLAGGVGLGRGARRGAGRGAHDVGGGGPVVGLRRRVEYGSDADLGPDDGLDAGRLAGLVEADRAVEAVVVGDRQGGHAEAPGGGDEFVDPPGAVAEREVGVHVQVDEAHADTLGMRRTSLRMIRTHVRVKRQGKARGRGRQRRPRPLGPGAGYSLSASMP